MAGDAGDWLDRRTLAPGWSSPLSRLVPYAFAVATGYQILKYLYVQPKAIGFDALLYTEASRAWLAGGNPWQVESLGIHYGAPPPTLIAFAPLTVLPDIAVIWGAILGSLVLAILALRSLRMPMWWLISWPLVEGTLAGNPDVALFASLVLLRGRLSWLAPILKAYGVFPLIGERRVRQVAIAAAALLLTALVLPWAQWWSELPEIAARLAQVSDTTSVYGAPVLVAIGLAALLLLGVRRASWLAVPVLWPSTQPHYMAMSIPALSPWLAIAWSLPHPYVVVSAVVIEAAVHVYRRPPVLTRGASAA